jgi:hypothetical protein
MADGTAGLRIFDVSNPTSPVLLGTYDTPGFAEGVGISGTVAYVADDLTGLLIIDVSNPGSPILLGSYDTPSEALDVEVSGTTAYVADYLSGLHFIDISNPSSPTLLGTYDTPGSAYRVAVSGGLVYLGDVASGLEIFNAGNPSSATLLGSYDTPDDAVGVAVSGSVAYVADLSSGLQILNVSTPASPTLLGSYNTPGTAMNVTVSGTLAYVADNTSGMHILDVGNPASPNLLGTFVATSVQDVAIAGTVAYLADGVFGLLIVNVSNPTLPTLIGAYDTPHVSLNVAVSGTVAYVADYLSGLRIINVSNPASPTELGYYDTPGNAYDVAIAGTLAYVADNTTGLLILDVSNPASPTLIGSCDTPGSAIGVVVSGTVAFVADQASGLHLIDVSNPASPRLIGSYATSQNANKLVISGNLAYLAAGTTGLQILEAFQNRFDLARNIGRSLELDATPDAIKKVRLTTTQVNNVTWDISANGGANWQAATSGGGWLALTTPGADLRWRASLAPVGLLSTAANPEVSRAEVEWLYTFPVLETIADIGNDQGRQVRLDWMRSANDFVGAVPQILSYAIYRRIDSSPQPIGFRAFDARPIGDLAASAGGGDVDALVAGWDFVTTVPADADDEYAVVVPTVADSTVASGQHWSAFRVRALTATPGVFYDSYADSGYSRDNLVPAPPAALLVTYEAGGGNHLTWGDPVDEDFDHFNVYRSTEPGFTPGPSSLVHATTATSWIDAGYVGGAAYYKLTAVDDAGNESGAASASGTVGVEASATPVRFALHAASPNPFREGTAFAYDVPSSGGVVRVGLYDISGRLVRSLVDGAQTPGRKSATWDGRDDQGRALPAGLYLVRMQAAGFAQMHKLVLTR